MRSSTKNHYEQKRRTFLFAKSLLLAECYMIEHADELKGLVAPLKQKKREN
jgi:hypothetical protein